MAKLNIYFVLTFFAAAIMMGCRNNVKDYSLAKRVPNIYPDYTETVLPPNIAPTNFVIQEDGAAYFVRISSERGKVVTIASSSPTIKIPIKSWRTLLRMNRGKSLQISIFVQDKNSAWTRFDPIKNQIATENMDSHLVYRIIPPIYMYYDKMHIYQRDLQTFKERTIADNKSLGNNCINCHSFHNNNPDRMIFHMRGGGIGTSMMMVYDDKVVKLDTKTAFNRPTSYRSWHPNGDIIAFAFNDVKQLFHAVGENRDVFDRVSDLLLYNIKTNTITSSPKISSDERMETYPEWSPDGKYLYFCSAPGLDFYDQTEHPYKQMRYDLMRIAYDVENQTCGEIEPVLLASEMEKSVAHAKPSPDGNYILLCLSDYSYFPLYRPESDLYVLDTRTNELHNANELNSEFAESYHCWSSNGRWIVFSSKRRDGLCTDLYFSYFDGKGNFSKPFLLPQKDPQAHQNLFRVYNVPELVTGPVKVKPQKLLKVAWEETIERVKLDPQVQPRSKEQSHDSMYPSFP